jgi:PadR family transcriptional regulator PadR
LVASIYLELLGGDSHDRDSEKTMPDPRADLLKGTLDLLILKALTFGPRHGYGIARWLEESSRELLHIEEGSLYPALSRMERRGWIRSEWGASETNRKAKYYQMTTRGQEQLATQADGWERLVQAMSLVLQRQTA